MHMEIVEYEYVVSRHAKNIARDGSILTDVICVCVPVLYYLLREFSG